MFGLYLLVVPPVLALVESAARQFLLRHTLTESAVARSGSGWYHHLADWRYPWWTVVVGAGVPTLSKVVADSAAAREVPDPAG